VVERLFLCIVKGDAAFLPQKKGENAAFLPQ